MKYLFTDTLKTKAEIILSLRKFFLTIDSANKPVNKDDLRPKFNKLGLDFHGHHEAVEFLLLLLTLIKAERGQESLPKSIYDEFRSQMLFSFRYSKNNKVFSNDEVVFNLHVWVRGKGSLNISLKDSFSTNIINESLERIHKSMSFLVSPKMLLIILDRFQYSAKNNKTVKVNDYFEFPDILDVGEFLFEGSGCSSVLGLISHQSIGSAHKGHYFSFVRMGSTWFKCDDTEITRSDIKTVFNDSFRKRASNAFLLIYELDETNISISPIMMICQH